MTSLPIDDLVRAIEHNDDVRSAVSSVWQKASNATTAQRTKLLEDLDEAVRRAPIHALGPVAILAGALVESGATHGLPRAAVRPRRGVRAARRILRLRAATAVLGKLEFMRE